MLINFVINKYSLKNMVRYLCQVADVSRSGYYNYYSEVSIGVRSKKEEQDNISKRNILEAFNYKHRKKGARQIKMTLSNKFDLEYNLKKIRRIMKKFDIVCPLRKPNPYRRMRKANLEHTVFPNILKREFNQTIPGKVFSTDITYLKYFEGKRAYLSTIKDLASKEIIAFYVSEKLEPKTATKLLEELSGQNKISFHPEALIHSDQGFEFTHHLFHEAAKRCGLQQSMSRRGNCWDNAPIESFFGHLKDEINMEHCKTFEELKEEINEYMDYYNNDRGQWDIKRMTPNQYKHHLNKKLEGQ